MVPREYSKGCVVTRETPYHVPEGMPKGHQNRDGRLDIGRVVWTKSELVYGDSAGECIPAYVDGVGVVELDPSCLRPF